MCGERERERRSFGHRIRESHHRRLRRWWDAHPGLGEGPSRRIDTVAGNAACSQSGRPARLALSPTQKCAGWLVSALAREVTFRGGHACSSPRGTSELPTRPERKGHSADPAGVIRGFGAGEAQGPGFPDSCDQMRPQVTCGGRDDGKALWLGAELQTGPGWGVGQLG